MNLFYFSRNGWQLAFDQKERLVLADRMLNVHEVAHALPGAPQAEAGQSQFFASLAPGCLFKCLATLKATTWGCPKGFSIGPGMSKQQHSPLVIKQDQPRRPTQAPVCS